MKISDLLVESADSIATYLAILGHDIDYYENGCSSIKEQYKDNPTPNNKIATQTILDEVNSRILVLVSDNELWDRLNADPEVEVAYNRYVTLYNSNDDFLQSIR